MRAGIDEAGGPSLAPVFQQIPHLPAASLAEHRGRHFSGGNGQGPSRGAERATVPALQEELVGWGCVDGVEEA
jgi:hypothetical protein